MQTLNVYLISRCAPAMADLEYVRAFDVDQEEKRGTGKEGGTQFCRGENRRAIEYGR